jgi:N6-L-threonylcarbamoyladenine synthase
MRILGIESSCDETAAAVVEDGRRVRSNAIASQTALHEEYGGVVPEIASRAHVELLSPVLGRALDEAGVGWRDIDAIAVANRPGLIGALLVGVAAAKAAAWSLGKPLIGVDHVEAHLYATLLDQPESPAVTHADVFPALGLVVSGGHTAMYVLEGTRRMRIIGRTIDDAVGEAYDKASAILGLGYPGGPIVDERAQRGDERSHELPISRLGRGSLDLSFSGLKTALLYAVRGTPVSDASGGKPRFERSAEMLSDAERDDFCASFQRAATRAIVMKLERALDAWATGAFGDTLGVAPRSLLVGGGVAANSRLRADVRRLGETRDIPVRIPAMQYCLDNAAMAAGLAYECLTSGDTDDLHLAASASSYACRETSDGAPPTR